MASSRTIAVVAAGVAAVAAAAVIGTTAGSEHADRAAADGAPAAAGTPSTGAPSGGASGATAGPSDGPAAGATGASGASGAASARRSPASELLPTPAGPSASATGYALPHPAAARSLLTGVPSAGAARGRLVAGFPAALAPPRGSRVESTSVAVVGRAVQAALVATGGDPRRILLHYRTALSARGFTEHAARGVENAPAAAFSNGADHVTVTTQDGRTYVFADLRAEDTQG